MRALLSFFKFIWYILVILFMLFISVIVIKMLVQNIVGMAISLKFVFLHIFDIGKIFVIVIGFPVGVTYGFKLLKFLVGSVYHGKSKNDSS